MCKNWLIKLSHKKYIWKAKDYWKLISISQKLSKPIFEITNTEINQRQWSIDNIDKAIKNFDEIKKNVIERITKRDY